jgi:aconitase A
VQPTPASATQPRYKEDQPPKSQTNSDSIISKLYALGDFVDTDAVRHRTLLASTWDVITTDKPITEQIIPAAFILNSPTDALLGSHCLEFTNPDFRDQVRSGLEVVVAGKAFGCGSSREEAPRALKGTARIFRFTCLFLL